MRVLLKINSFQPALLIVKIEFHSDTLGLDICFSFSSKSFIILQIIWVPLHILPSLTTFQTIARPLSVCSLTDIPCLTQDTLFCSGISRNSKPLLKCNLNPHVSQVSEWIYCFRTTQCIKKFLEPFHVTLTCGSYSYRSVDSPTPQHCFQWASISEISKPAYYTPSHLSFPLHLLEGTPQKYVLFPSSNVIFNEGTLP